MTEPQDVLAERDDAIRAALFAHDGMERLIREDGMPREAVEPEPVGFLAALKGLGFTVAALVRTPETLDVPVPRSLLSGLISYALAEPSNEASEAARARVIAEARRLAASPAPDPGAVLREALEDAMVTLHHISDDAEFRVSAIRSMLAPSAEPPETET